MVLIVDDKAENIFSLQRTLELHGFEVDSANSGEEALKKILRQHYALIVLDVQMPGMDGFEVAEAISGFSKAKDIPIILLSAVNTDKKFVAKGYTSGGVDYVTKPVDPDIFMLKVKTLYRLSEQHRDLEQARQQLLEEVAVRKKAEEALKIRMQELKSVLESLPQIAFTLKPDGAIEFVNEHWFLYAHDTATMPLLHGDDRHVQEEITTSIRNGRPLVAEVRIRNMVTNSFRYHLLRMIPVRQQGGSILKWVGTFTDIQEQKIANEILEHKVQERTEELQEQNKKLESSNHELQQFASVSSHDLKEPLRKIQVFSSIIQERHLKDTPEAHSSMARVVDAAQRMSRLINDLLDYSRLSVDVLFQPTDLNGLLREVVNDLEAAINDTGAVIEYENLDTIPAIPGQVRQVFQNLISNSLKFTRPGVFPHVRISSAILREAEDKYAEIRISDNGIGFEQQYAEKIFTIFQRLNAHTAYEGTGIGLAIVRKIMEKHGGDISADSRPGEGSTFTLRFPLHHPTTQPVQLASGAFHA